MEIDTIKIPIEDFSFDESYFVFEGKRWKASDLYDFAKAKEYPIMDMPLWCIDLSCRGFSISSLSVFIFQCKRVENCSLDHPILLTDKGVIADGYHRVCKAILQGKKTIKAIRLLDMPTPYSDSED